MKQKLTITIDAELLPAAKRYARLPRSVAFVAHRAVSQGGGRRVCSFLRRAVAGPISGGGARRSTI